jgi:transcription antitermination factor NusG
MKLGDKVKVIKGDYNGRVGIIKSKDHMKIKIDDRVRIVRGEHIGKVGIVKSIDHAVIGSYPNQTYTKTFSIMSNNGNVFSIDANDAKLIEG